MCRKLLKASVASANLGSDRPCLEKLVSTSPRSWASLVAQQVKNPPAMWEPWVGKIPWRRGSTPIGYPLQYSGLENFTECTVLGVTKNQPQLSNFHFHFSSWSWGYYTENQIIRTWLWFLELIYI